MMELVVERGVVYQDVVTSMFLVGRVWSVGVWVVGEGLVASMSGFWMLWSC
jgi:hypothetical protein